jgi:hypothetical protein
MAPHEHVMQAAVHVKRAVLRLQAVQLDLMELSRRRTAAKPELAFVWQRHSPAGHESAVAAGRLLRCSGKTTVHFKIRSWIAICF